MQFNWKWAAIATTAVILYGCTTTEEANKAIQSRWIGPPADMFFSQYGPPESVYRMTGGGNVYTWRGGDKTRYVPAQYERVETPAVARSVTTEVTNGQVTKTSTSTVGVSMPARERMISPARNEQLFCEIQISTDPADRIQSIRASNDTDGEGLSLSRCAEVMGVKS